MNHLINVLCIFYTPSPKEDTESPAETKVDFLVLRACLSEVF